MTLRLGVHPNNASLTAFADAYPDAEGVSFFRYGSGSQTIPLLRAGALDVVGTGATPPMLAQSRGLDPVLLATTAPRPERGGLIVRADSGIRSLADLAGRAVALMPVSWHVQYLAAVLDSVGMKLADTTAVEIDTGTAKDAFAAGLVPAMVATGANADDLSAACETVVLAGVGEHFSNRSVLWAPRRTVVDRGDELTDVVRRIAATPGVHIAAPDTDFVSEQQRHADLLATQGVLDISVDIRESLCPLSLFPSVDDQE